MESTIKCQIFCLIIVKCGKVCLVYTFGVMRYIEGEFHSGIRYHVTGLPDADVSASFLISGSFHQVIQGHIPE
jgi:hypothetical protein